MLRLEETEANHKSLMTKGETEKELHNKNLEKVNSQVELLRKELTEAKRSETKLR